MRHRLALIPFLILALFSPGIGADAPAASKTVHLLTIGNSFSHNAMHYFKDIAKADGNTVVLAELIIGGASMQVHWDKAQLHEKNPTDKAGIYYAGKGLKELLASDKWDYVAIQQASIKSHNVETYRPYAMELHDYVAKYAPGAELLLHETWEYRVDDPRFSAKAPAAGEPKTQEEMYKGLAASYATIASEMHVRIIPVGDAFHLADTDPQWGFKPDTTWDPKTAKQPQLPNQTHSLHVGWKWVKPTKPADAPIQLRMDGHHAASTGEYLGGCVFYEVLFNHSCVGNAFLPPGVTPEEAKYLQQTAHRAVEASRKKP